MKHLIRNIQYIYILFCFNTLHLKYNDSYRFLLRMYHSISCQNSCSIKTPLHVRRFHNNGRTLTSTPHISGSVANQIQKHQANKRSERCKVRLLKIVKLLHWYRHLKLYHTFLAIHNEHVRHLSESLIPLLVWYIRFTDRVTESGSIVLIPKYGVRPFDEPKISRPINSSLFLFVKNVVQQRSCFTQISSFLPTWQIHNQRSTIRIWRHMKDVC